MAKAELVKATDLRFQEFERAALILIDSKSSKHTRKAYRADLKRWMTFCSALSVDPLRPGLPATIRFRENLSSEVAAPSVRRVLSALSFIYRELLNVHTVTLNPFHQSVLPWPRVSREGKTPMVPDDIAEAMITEAMNDPDRHRGRRDAAILRLLYDTGLRRESVAEATRVAWTGRLLHVRVKGNLDTDVELPIVTQTALTEWLRIAESSHFLFPGARGGPINPNTINKIIGARASAVGAGWVHPHCFRAAFVTATYDLKVPERDAQGATKHSDRKSLERYDRGRRGSGVTDLIAAWRASRNEAGGG